MKVYAILYGDEYTTRKIVKILDSYEKVCEYIDSHDEWTWDQLDIEEHEVILS